MPVNTALTSGTGWTAIKYLARIPNQDVWVATDFIAVSKTTEAATQILFDLHEIRPGGVGPVNRYATIVQ